MPLRSRIQASAAAAFLFLAVSTALAQRPVAEEVLGRIDDALGHAADAQYARSLDELEPLLPAEAAWTPDIRLRQIGSTSRLRRRQNLDAELARYLELHAASPHAADAWIRRGLNALQQRHYGQARLYLDQAVQEATAEEGAEDEAIAGTASYWLGIAHLVDPDGALTNQALLALSAAAQLYPRNQYADDALLALGQYHESTGSLDTALGFYAEVLARYPSGDNAIEAAIRSAQTLLRLDRTPAAIALLDRIGVDLSLARQRVDADVATLEQQTTEYNLLRAEASAKSRDYPTAERSYLAVIYQPETPYRRVALLGLADTYRAASQPDSATAIYQRIRAEDARDFAGMHAEFQLAIAALAPVDGITSDRAPMLQIVRDTMHLLHDQARLALAKVHYLAGELDSVEAMLARIPASTTHPAARAQAFLLRGVTRLAARRHSAAAEDLLAAAAIAQATPASLMSDRSTFQQFALLHASIAMVHTGRASDAVSQLNRVLLDASDPHLSAEAAYWLGEAYYAAGLLPSAVQALEELIERHPTSTRIEDALFTIGWAHYRQRKFGSAESAFARLVKAYPMTAYAPMANVRRGDCLYLSERYADAVRAYNSIDTTIGDPAVIEYARYQGALASYHADDLNGALGRFERFSAAYPSSELVDDADFMCGLILYRQKSYRAAADRLAQFSTAHAKSSLRPRALTTLAGALLSVGAIDSAYAAAAEVVNQFPSSYYASDAAVGMERAEAARKERTRLARAAERAFESDLAAADRALRSGDAAGALATYRRLAGVAPDAVSADHISLGAGRAALAVGDTTAAADTLRVLTRRAPNPLVAVAAYETLASIAEAQHINESARLYLRSIADLSDSAAPHALVRIADLYATDSSWTDAVATLTLVIDRYASQRRLVERATLKLGEVYAASGDNPRARETYRKLLDGDDDEVIRTAEQRLRTLEEL